MTDGLHYNDFTIHQLNFSVSQTMANALHYAADHLPVVTSFKFYNSLGISAYSTEGYVLAYPNPTNGNLTIELEQPTEHIALTVMDANGKLVGSSSYSNVKVLNLYLEGSSGVYTVHLSSRTKHTTFKVLKR